MATPTFISSLSIALSPEARVLSEKTSAEFKDSLARWSDYGIQTPSAIVQPATEKDIVTAVKELVSASIPFVPASGGHSPFSTIGKDGVVIDLSRFTGVEVDEANNLATIKGGTLAKQVQTVLHPYKRFVAVGSSSTVGFIPYYLGGGVSAYSPFYGYACENIVAARLITAKGELIQVSENENPKVLWGIRGAGQFLGLVTQITIRTLPYSTMGNEQGQRMVGMLAFTPDKLDSVCAAMIPIMESKEHASTGHFSVTLAPPEFQHQVILAVPEVFASPEKTAEILKPLTDLEPIMKMLMPSTFDKHSDAFEYLSAKGDFKRFSQIGMTGFRVEEFRELVKLHSELVSTCPDGATSGFTVEWHPECIQQRPDTAFGHHGVDYWLNVLSWYKDAKNHAYMESMDKRAQAAVRAADKEDDYITYTNTSREDPIEWRYKGEDRIARLRALKKQWDPSGVFTKQFL